MQRGALKGNFCRDSCSSTPGCRSHGVPVKGLKHRGIEAGSHPSLRLLFHLWHSQPPLVPVAHHTQIAQIHLCGAAVLAQVLRELVWGGCKVAHAGHAPRSQKSLSKRSYLSMWASICKTMEVLPRLTACWWLHGAHAWCSINKRWHAAVCIGKADSCSRSQRVERVCSQPTQTPTSAPRCCQTDLAQSWAWNVAWRFAALRHMLIAHDKVHVTQGRDAPRASAKC